MARNKFEAKGNYFNCCKHCTERYVGCHSDCEKYLEDKAKYEAAKAEYSEAVKEYSQLDGYEYKKRAQYKREKKRKAMR